MFQKFQLFHYIRTAAINSREKRFSVWCGIFQTQCVQHFPLVFILLLNHTLCSALSKQCISGGICVCHGQAVYCTTYTHPALFYLQWSHAHFCFFPSVFDKIYRLKTFFDDNDCKNFLTHECNFMSPSKILEQAGLTLLSWAKSVGLTYHERVSTSISWLLSKLPDISWVSMAILRSLTFA